MNSTQLEQLRTKVDAIDKALLVCLAHRLKVIGEIGEYKAKHGLVVEDLEREKEMKLLRDELCEKYKLEPIFIHALFEAVIAYSKESEKLYEMRFEKIEK